MVPVAYPVLRMGLDMFRAFEILPAGRGVPPCRTVREKEAIAESPPMSASKTTQVWDAESFARIAHGAFPAATAFYLSSVTGIPVRSVEKHLRAEAKPGADHLLAYLNAGALGARLRAALLCEL